MNADYLTQCNAITAEKNVWRWAKYEDHDAEIARLRAELDAAKAIIEKLPKTADGVVIAPGDKIYIRSRYEDGVECMIAYIEAANLRRQVGGAFSGCYSTGNAALAEANRIAGGGEQ